MTTFRTMDVSDLGDNCTSADLAAFINACRVRQFTTGESDEAVTAWMWGDGDWGSRVATVLGPTTHPPGCSCGNPECPEWQAAMLGTS